MVFRLRRLTNGSIPLINERTHRTSLIENAVRAGRNLSVSFHRTLRIPDDGNKYPLPPGLGRFPLRAVRDYAVSFPREYHQDFFLPIYVREALWIGFDCEDSIPSAVKIAAGRVNVVTGDLWNENLHDSPQDYIVCPDQPWIDGINSDSGAIRQFVAMPLGEGYTIEEQLTGSDRVGGLQFVVFEAKEGKFVPSFPLPTNAVFSHAFAEVVQPELGLAIGGEMHQKIYPDRYGIDTWDPGNRYSFVVHLVRPVTFSIITGEPLPPTPVDAKAYTDAGLPWFDLYDDDEGDLRPSQQLQTVRSIREMEEQEPEPGIIVQPSQIKHARE